MSIAVDLESAAFRSLRREDRRLVGRTCPAVYIAVPPAESERRLLERAGIPYAICDENLLIYGRHAVSLAPLLHVPVYPALPEGRLPTDDPIGRQLIATMLESLLPRRSATGAPCGVILPAAGDDRSTALDAEFFTHFLRLQGYAPVTLSRPMALTLAELGRSSFTGMSIVIDSRCCMACITHQGVQVLEASLPRGGNWLDEEMARRTNRTIWDTAGNAYLDVASVTRWSREQPPSIESPRDGDAELLRDLYTEILSSLMAAIGRDAADSAILRTMTRSIPVVCCGPATQIDGFQRLLTRQLKEIELPVEVAEVRVVDDAEFTLARGALIRAELEAETLARCA